MLRDMRSCVSPVQGQDYIWLAESANGSIVTEFDMNSDKKENNFYKIDRSTLIRFGLIGNGMNLYFESDGIFKIVGQTIELIYKVGEKEYYLTGRQQMYNDIICYKDAEVYANAYFVDPNTNWKSANSMITQYNFGYKTSFTEDDIKFNTEITCSIPYKESVYMSIWLVADQKLDGTLIVKNRGRIMKEIVAPLEQGIGGMMNWRVTT